MWLNRIRKDVGTGIPEFTRPPEKNEGAAIPCLTHALRALYRPNSDDMRQAVRVARLIGDKALTSLISIVNGSGSDIFRANAAKIIGRLGALGIAAIPHLEKAQLEGPKMLLAAATRSLTMLRKHGPTPNAAKASNVTGLLDMLSSPDFANRRAAKRALAALGQDAVPSLVEQLLHGRIQRQRNAADVLCALRERAIEAIPDLTRVLGISCDPLLRSKVNDAVKNLQVAEALKARASKVAQLTPYTISSQGLRISCEGDTDVCSWLLAVH